MKEIIKKLMFILIVIITLSSCKKETFEPEKIIVTDSIYVHDTIIDNDTLLLTDSIYVHDTTYVTLYDTIIDNVYIYDTIQNYISIPGLPYFSTREMFYMWLTKDGNTAWQFVNCQYSDNSQYDVMYATYVNGNESLKQTILYYYSNSDGTFTLKFREDYVYGNYISVKRTHYNETIEKY